MTNQRKNHAARRAATLAPLALVAMFLVAAFGPSVTAATLANVDVSAPRQHAKAVETWWVQFNTVGAIPKGGDIRISFPAGFQVSHGGTSRCDIHMPSTLVTENTSVELDGRTVVCGLGAEGSIPGNTLVRISISNVRNPEDPGTTGAFSIQTRTASDGLIDQHSSNVENILPEQVDGLSSVDVRAPMQKAGAMETWTFRFTPRKAIPQSGNVRIVFPMGFSLSAEPASQCQWNTSGIRGDNSTLVGTREIQCALGASEVVTAGRVVRLNVTGVRNPSTEQYSEPFLIQSRDGQTVLDESTMDQELISAHNFFAGPVHRQNTTAPGALANHRFEFILFNGWGGDGMFEVRLPSGYSYDATGGSAPNLTFEHGGSGKFAPQLLEDRLLVFKRIGGQPLFNGAHLLVRLDNIRNPTSANDTGFTIATLNATRAAHDRGVVSAGVMQPAPTTPAATTSTTTPPPTTTNETAEPTNTTTTDTTTPSPIGPVDADPTTSGPAGQGSPGLEAAPVLAALVVAMLLYVRRRRA